MRILITIIFGLILFTSCENNNTTKNYLQYVNTFIGTGGHGHTYPGATAPFGMVQVSPDTRLTGWDGCSGYHYSDSVIYGFSHTHLSGTGVSDYGDILLMPVVGDFNNLENYNYASSFSHDKENASPGYYEVFLDKPKTKVKLTSTPRVGIHRYKFSTNTNNGVVIDLMHRDEVIDSKINIISNTEVEGYRISKAWAQEQHVYFYIKFSVPFTSSALFNDSTKITEQTLSSEKIKSIFYFDNESEILCKVAISSVSEQSAKKNMLTEAPHFDFEKYKTNVQDSWNKSLSKIQIKDESIENKTNFYTALYHTMIVPNIYNDINGKYRGTDLKVHQTKKSINQYTVFSLWDTYRATHPLYTIIEQKRTNDFIHTFLNQYKQGGKLPMWELSANYTGCMIGYHAVPVIADAYLKGIWNSDPKLALEASISASKAKELGKPFFRQHGYLTAEVEHEAVSKSLEYAYDDWCIAQIAKKMKKKDVYEEYIKTAQGYKNLFDKQSGFIRSKLNGLWFSPFDPSEVNFNYTEANGWQYNFHVQQDVNGLIDIYGGDENFAKKLDEMFNAENKTTGRHQVDITGLIGQYAHGNEPSHHVAYLYNYAGKAHKTQQLVRRILKEQYYNAPDGLCGNEDCGQMSAWYVFSALGFYPVNPAAGFYDIGSPIFKEASINLESGKSFKIITKNNSESNIYIESIQLNGEDYPYSYIKHEDIMKGGILTYTMTDKPSDFGKEQQYRPVSKISENNHVTIPHFLNSSTTFKGSKLILFQKVDDNIQIHYTVDKSNPNVNSPVYKMPFEITKTTTIKAIAINKNGIKSGITQTTFHKLDPNISIDIKNEYASQYSAGGDNALIDHIRGGNNYRNGLWQGYYHVPLEAIINLGKSTKIKSLSIGFLQDQNSWIFMPESVDFYSSTTGKNYKKIGTVENQVSQKEENPISKDFKVTTNINAKYIKVVAHNPGLCPEWHKGVGNKSWIFADEIIINEQ